MVWRIEGESCLPGNSRLLRLACSQEKSPQRTLGGKERAVALHGSSVFGQSFVFRLLGFQIAGQDFVKQGGVRLGSEGDAGMLNGLVVAIVNGEFVRQV